MAVSIEEQSDDWLLTQFVSTRDSAAFAVLIERHGSLVWGVCRRVLGDTSEAEDAFQATFIVLVRKAATLRRSTSIAGWLYQVAHRSALRSRKRRSRAERPVDPQNLADVPERTTETDDERVQVLHDEIARLPESLRLPIVLCYLEGWTNSRTARHIGCPEGTIVSRLARARERLHRRLTSRGVVLGGAAGLMALFNRDVSAAVPPHLFELAFQCSELSGAGPLPAEVPANVAQLAGDVLRQMSWRKFARWGIALALVVLLGGFAGIVHQGEGRINRPAAGDSIPQVGLEILDGTWVGDQLEFAPGATDDEKRQYAAQLCWIIDGANVEFLWQWLDESTAKIELARDEPPRGIQFAVAPGKLTFSGKQLDGRYAVEEDVLHVCTSQSGQPARLATGQVMPAGRSADSERLGLAGLAVLRRTGGAAVGRTALAAVTGARQNLDGIWDLESWEVGGVSLAVDPRQRAELSANHYKLVTIGPDGAELAIEGSYVLDPVQPARNMDMIPSSGLSERFFCIYEIQGDRLQLSMAAPGMARPDDFSTTPGDTRMKFAFNRRQPPAPD